MFRHSSHIFSRIEAWLKYQDIPCRSIDCVGVISFRAMVSGSDSVFKFRVNVTLEGFWVEVTSPVIIPQKEKVIARLTKFSNRVNLTENSGGFLVVNYPEGKLLYRQYIAVQGDPDPIIERMLCVPARVLNHYGQMIDLLIRGKISVNEAIARLENTCWQFSSSELVPPDWKKEARICKEQLELQLQMKKELQACLAKFLEEDQKPEKT